MEGQNATIDWGDGSAPEVIVANKTYHTYPDLSYYNIEISNATNLTMADLEQASSPALRLRGCLLDYRQLSSQRYFSSSTDAKQNLVSLRDDVFKNDAGRTNWSLPLL